MPRASRTGAGARPPLAGWKRLLFGAATAAVFFALLEGVLALAHVRPVVDTEDPYVGFVTSIPLFVEQRQADGSLAMVTAPNKLAWFNPQSFPRHKPPGTVRIFALGGSTTFGHPYDDRTSFAGWLRELLPRVDPARRWEVVNAGGVSYASYRIANLLQELVRYQPDVFVIYTGENEFLERRTYQGLMRTPSGVNRLGALAGRTRTYAAVRAAVQAVRPTRQQEARRAYTMTGEVEALLDAIGGISQYTRDDTLQSQIAAHYRFNMRRMAEVGRAAGARVVFVTPAANLKDCSPFKSQASAGLDAADARQFAAALERAEAAGRAGDLQAARAALEEATDLDPRHAEALYRLGQVQLVGGDAAAAHRSFQRAVDEDVCPLRQPSALRRALLEVARAERVPLVDFARLIEDSCQARLGHRIAGAEFFLDHVHPTIEGNRLLAVAVVEQLAADGVVHPAAPDWEAEAVAAAADDIEARLDVHLQATGLRNVARVFSWAGKTEEAERLVRQAIELDPSDAESYTVLGNQAAARHDPEAAQRYYHQALQANPNDLEARNNLAAELSRAGRYEAALEHYVLLLKRRPDQPAVQSNAGHACLKLGRHAEAARYFARLVELRPEDAAARSNLGLALHGAGRLDEAAARYREALELDSKDVETRTRLARVLGDQGLQGAALEELREAVRVDPKQAKPRVVLGAMLRERGELDAARVELEAALQLAPEDAEAHNHLGLVLLRQGRRADALQHFNAALRAQPDDPDTRLNHAFILAAEGRPGDAVREYREALRLRPDDPKVLNALAWILATGPDAAHRDGAEAVQLAERANRLSGQRHPAALMTLAAAYAEVGRFDDAVTTAEKAQAAARSGGHTAAARDIERFVALYRARKPYREPRP
jgi:tetratricopeptide (TPR) repeat protein